MGGFARHEHPLHLSLQVSRTTPHQGLHLKFCNDLLSRISSRSTMTTAAKAEDDRMRACAVSVTAPESPNDPLMAGSASACTSAF
eukprot:56483-Eustigmatos_ZCMA.PRE.1